MAYSRTLWDIISGNYPGGQNYNPATSSLAPITDTQRRFTWFFGGYDPITGYARTGGSAQHPPASQYGISSYEDLVTKYPTPGTISGGMDKVINPPSSSAPPVIEHTVTTGTPQPKPIPENYTPPAVIERKINKLQEITADDIDKMLMKVHGINLDRYPNEARWMLSVAKSKLQQLQPRERAFLRDPFIPEEQKTNFLKGLIDWSKPEYSMERWMRRKLDEAINIGKGLARDIRERKPVRPIEASGVFSPFSSLGLDEENRNFPESLGRSVASPIV